MILLLGIGLVACRSTPQAPVVLRLSDHGRPRAAWTLAELKQRSPAERVQVWDPFEQQPVDFQAMPLPPLLDAALGPGWRRAEQVLFVARDGYTAPVPVSRLLAKPSWLAFARGDGTQLQLAPRAGGTIDATPFYVVWDTLRDLDLRAEGDHGWPFQTVSLDVVTVAERYPALALPAEASPAAVRGRELFLGWCSSCHAVHGQGGRVGPELVAPVGVVHTWQPAWLAAWIDDPQRVRAGAKMAKPPLPAGDRRAHIHDILAFLRAITPSPPQLP
jgi:cytochrome c2